MEGGCSPVAVRERRLGALATRQSGVVSRAQLRVLGLGPGAIDDRVAVGRLHVVHRGVYAVGHRSLSRRGQLLAAVLAGGPGALLSHHSAAEVWEIRDPRPGRVHVASFGRGRRGQHGIHLHRPRNLQPHDRAIRDGIPLTALPRTLLDLAIENDRRTVRRAIGRAERQGRLDLGAVLELLDRTRGHPGRRVLRQVLTDLAPAAPTRSELEERFLELVRGASLPAPAVNAWVAGMEVDAVWPRARLAVELDGYAHHGGREAFESDRARGLALAASDYEVVRITWRMLMSDPDAVVRLLRARLR